MKPGASHLEAQKNRRFARHLMPRIWKSIQRSHESHRERMGCHTGCKSASHRKSPHGNSRISSERMSSTAYTSDCEDFHLELVDEQTVSSIETAMSSPNFAPGLSPDFAVAPFHGGRASFRDTDAASRLDSNMRNQAMVNDSGFCFAMAFATCLRSSFTRFSSTSIRWQS